MNVETLKKDPSNHRFFRKVKVVSGCWNFSDIQPSNGYGKFTTKGVTWRAHRWIMSALGFIDRNDKICVLHKCDNRACVNPDHLYLGDRYQNAQDLRQRRWHLLRDSKIGSKNPRSKLSEKDVVKIKRRLLSGESGKLLAFKFNVSPSTISEIKNNKVWSHI